MPRIGERRGNARPEFERFYHAPLDNPTAAQCLAPKSDTHDPASCNERGKHPIGSHVRNASNDPGVIAMWRRKGYNTGVVCGPSGVVILDEDALGELERFCADRGHVIPRTYRVRTAKGWHYYFAMPEGAHFGNRSPFKREGYNLDVRAGSGAYGVAAGSVHATGVVYKAEDPDAPVAVMPEWLTSYLSTPARRPVKEGPQEACASYTGDDAYTSGTHYERAAVNGNIAALEFLARPWSEGAGYDEGTYTAACNLIELANVPFFDLAVADAEELIRQHAPTDEVWGPEQVEAKIASAHQTVGTRMRRDLPIDVVAEAAALIAPDLSELEDQVWTYHRTGYSGKPPARHAVKFAIRGAWATRDKPVTVSSEATAKRSLNLVNLAGVEFDVTEWAWKDVIPLGVVTGVAGTAGIGKSTVISWIVAALTRGSFEGDLHGEPASVLIVAGEDDLGRQLAPRLSVACADIARVAVVQPTVVAEGQEIDTVMQLGEDLPEIRRMLIETGAKMLVLDPVLSFVDGNPNNQADVRRALDPLAALARELNIAVVVVMHFKKGHGVAGEKVSGSHVWRDALRSLLVMAIDEESQYRVVTIDKSNYSNARGKSMLFEVTGAVVRGKDTKGQIRDQFVSKAEYLGDSSKSVQDLLEAENAKRDGRRVVNEDTAEIIGWICDQPEPVTWTAIARQAGYDPNSKDGETKKELSALNRKLGRAVDRGDIDKPGKGLYAKPSGLRPIAGLGGEEF